MPFRPLHEIQLRRPLTPGQHRVLSYVGQILLAGEDPTHARVAQLLGVSPRTVKAHVKAIANALPEDWLPRWDSRDRVRLYAMRTAAQIDSVRDSLLDIVRADNARASETPHTSLRP